MRRREFIEMFIATAISWPADAETQMVPLRALPTQPIALTQAQLDALAAYNKALNQFKSILSERHTQIKSHQSLPNLPGQALYLARINVMSAYKDLTDALPSKIGRGFQTRDQREKQRYRVAPNLVLSRRNRLIARSIHRWWRSGWHVQAKDLCGLYVQYQLEPFKNCGLYDNLA